MGPAVSIEHVNADPVRSRSIEFVERKGIGHPDSICDGVAEAVSRALSQYYLETFDRVLHHNTDKVHLGAGVSQPQFGGGELIEPIYILVGGRATKSHNGHTIPVAEIAETAARNYLLDTFDELEPGTITIDTRIGEASADLKDLFDRDATVRANDTSFGVGYAPLSPTEHVTRSLESVLREDIDAIGPDIKIMTARRDDHLDVTIAAAVIDRYVADTQAYRGVVDQVKETAQRHLRANTSFTVTIHVNAADDYETESLYLTTTGLSAEMGDDGSVGRGNRPNGLITPHRPMSLEATAGKNPVTHVGKLYNLKATQLAHRLHDQFAAQYSAVRILSRIGAPVTKPHIVDVTTTLTDTPNVREVLTNELTSLRPLTQQLIEGQVTTF